MLENKSKLNPGVASILSFIFPALGQLYNGQIMKAIIIMVFSLSGIVTIVCGALLVAFFLLDAVIFSRQVLLGSVLFFIGLLIICVNSLYSIFDAYQTAQKRNI